MFAHLSQHYVMLCVIGTDDDVYRSRLKIKLIHIEMVIVMLKYAIIIVIITAKFVRCSN
jgi:hypothetical protein